MRHRLPAREEDYPLYLPPPRQRHSQSNPASVLLAAIMLIGIVVASCFLGASLLRYGPALFRAPVEMHDAPVEVHATPNIYVHIDNGQKQPTGETVTVDPGTYQVEQAEQEQPPEYTPPAYTKYRAQQTYYRNEKGEWETEDPYSASDDWRVLTWSDYVYVKPEWKEGRDPEREDHITVKYDPDNPTPEHTYVYYGVAKGENCWVEFSEAESERLFVDDIDKGYLPMSELSSQAIALYNSIKGR